MVSSAFKLLSPHTVCQVGSVNPDTGHYFACTCDPESGRVIDCQYYKVWVSNIQGDSKNSWLNFGHLYLGMSISSKILTYCIREKS